MSTIELVTSKEQRTLAIRERVKVEEIPQTMGRIFGEVASYMQMNGIPMAGPPFAYYHSWSDQETDLECGFPVAVQVQVGDRERIRELTLPAVRVVTAMHVGPYPKIVETYTAMMEWMKANGHQPADYMWEFYLNSPMDTPPEKLMTQIVYPIK